MKQILSTILILTSLVSSLILPFTVNASFNTNLDSIYDNNTDLITKTIKDYTPVRVLLSTPRDYNYFIVRSPENFKVLSEKKEVVSSTSMVGVLYFKNQIVLVFLNGDKPDVKYDMKTIQILPLKKEQPLIITNWNRHPEWDKTGKVNDNMFLGGLDFRYTDGFLNVVNEIDLKDYMRGIAEVPEGDQMEKRKVLQVISRSYVSYYTSQDKYLKFPGKHYNASDDPNVFQKYRGYGFTLRSPQWQKALEEVGGEVITYNDKVLRAAYFSCTSNNGYTKSPKDAKWTDDYFMKEVPEVYQSIEDKIGVDITRLDKPGQCGHWVGLSGYGATKLAEKGWSYKDILKHYYQKIDFKKMY